MPWLAAVDASSSEGWVQPSATIGRTQGYLHLEDKTGPPLCNLSEEKLRRPYHTFASDKYDVSSHQKKEESQRQLIYKKFLFYIRHC